MAVVGCKGDAYLEVDGVAVFEARLHLGDSVFRVPVEDVKMGDAFAGEKWSRHGAVEPDNASKKMWFQLQAAALTSTCRLAEADFSQKVESSQVELTVRIENASAEDGVHAFLEGITCTLNQTDVLYGQASVRYLSHSL